MTRRSAIGLMGSVLVGAASAPAALRSTPEKGSILSGHVTDAETKQQIPCTVSIRTSQGSIITESQSFMGGFRSTGQFEKAVPSGLTTIGISRGFDYVAQERKLLLRPGERAELKFELERRAHMRRRGWYCGDNHVHMTHGAAKIIVDFPDVALGARAAGLDYMSIAQNWNLPPSQITPAHLSALCKSLSTPDFIFDWNMEAPKNYWRGDVTHCLGHCWTLGMHGYTPKGGDAIQELFQMSAHDYESEKTPTPNFESQALIHALGGIVAYTHPCRWWWGTWGGRGIYPVEPGKFISNLSQELPYDTAVGPTYDAMDVLMQSWDREEYMEAQGLWFMLLNKGYRIPGTASTDSAFDSPGHALPGIVRVYTRVEGPPSIAAIAHAMKAGRNFVTSGPLLLMEIGGHRVGDVIQLRQPANFQAQLQAWASGAIGEHLTKVELIRNGDLLKQFVVSDQRKEFATEFSIHETETAWYIARCYGSNDLQVAITNPIYFEAGDYRQPQPAMAHVTGIVTDAAGKPLDGECTVIRMVGLTPVEWSTHHFSEGRFILDIPGTARLQVQAAGYKVMMKSVFMDYEPLLRMTLNLREAELTDWRTFQEIKELLGNVNLKFQLAPSDSANNPRLSPLLSSVSSRRFSD